MANIKQLEKYAESIYSYYGYDLLKYKETEFDDFSTDLDFAIMDGDVMNIPELEREDAFKSALNIASEEHSSEPDESMDGDFDSGMTSAGMGTDEDYGYYGENDFFGESTMKEADEIMSMLKDSFASKKAKKLGLVHVGFGNYAEDPGSRAEYKTVDGKLRKIGGTIPKKQIAQVSAKKKPAKEDPKKVKEKPKQGIRNLRRVSGLKFTYEAEVNGKNIKFTLNKQERKQFGKEGSLLGILKKRIEKKAEREKSKQFKKGKHVISVKK
jgi:hypothetical protein